MSEKNGSEKPKRKKVLKLRKETLRKLTNEELEKVAGGGGSHHVGESGGDEPEVQ
jgi:hypothetical protein